MLCVIDQHGAHARIIYEKLQERKSQGSSSQLLLIPYTFDTNYSEAKLIVEYLSYLNEIGISIKEFGPNTFHVDAIPSYFGNVNLQELVKDIFDSLLHHDTSSLEYDREKHIALAAGRAAVLKNKKLPLEEAQGLLKQLMQCRAPFQCPQGNSTLAQIKRNESGPLFQIEHLRTPLFDLTFIQKISKIK